MTAHKYVGAHAPIPDVIVLGVHAVDETLDRVSGVVEHKDDRRHAKLLHDRELLEGELAVTLAFYHARKLTYYATATTLLDHLPCSMLEAQHNTCSIGRKMFVPFFYS